MVAHTINTFHALYFPSYKPFGTYIYSPRASLSFLVKKMAQSIDFNALKARTMGSSNDEEAVTVDTRGLISKVLSRYSGKWFAFLLFAYFASYVVFTRG